MTVLKIPELCVVALRTFKHHGYESATGQAGKIQRVVDDIHLPKHAVLLLSVSLVDSLVITTCADDQYEIR